MRRNSGKSIRGITKRKTEKNMYSPHFLLCSGMVDFRGNILSETKEIIILLSFEFNDMFICTS